ncbi:U6 snRNA phosphodiesterase 1 isoform X1 [Drosophila bipectinata]|uniref:U6 snRNA phosphodiesterase 1 isoform X1 n=2 Tax=Drosophila bipectinata TaxID=42026 RepID=UPI001C893F81|nr:U6 snRNA phosphodiesterase [Drosophila bipectinata]
MALVDYVESSSSASEGEDPLSNTSPAVSQKRFALPTAETLLGCKKPKPEEVVDDPAQHGGRIRSFKHERGNWATYIYVPAGACEEQLEDFQAEAMAKLAPEVELTANESLHLSLSRTVVLQYHQIEEFSRSLKTALHSCTGFSASLQGLRIYTNDEGTRTFVAAQLDAAFTEKTTKLLKPIDSVMLEYRLPPFYDPPSFHVSLLWCVGDQTKVLTEKLDELQQLLANQETLPLAVTEVHLKCGNKDFSYSLK